MSGIDPATVESVRAALRDPALGLPAVVRRHESLDSWILRLAEPPQRALVWDGAGGWRASIVLDELPGDRRLLAGTVTVLGPRGTRHAPADELVLERELEPQERRLLSGAQRQAEREAHRARQMLEACDVVVRGARSAARRGHRDASGLESELREALRGHPAIHAAAEQISRTWQAYRAAQAQPLTAVELSPPLSALGDAEAMVEFLRHPRGARHTPPRRPRPEIESTLH
jgi:hypothetical protein